MPTFSRVAAVAATFAFAVPSVVHGQIRGSEKGVVAQTVDGTTVTVEYHRPAARGRALFGELVPFDSPWTGANWATTFATDRPVRLNGVNVPVGRYSVWMVPAPDRWSVFLDPRAELYHFQKPDSTPDQIWLSARPERGPHVETLTWTFPSVTGAGTVLALAWGETRVPLEVVVEPSKPPTIAADVRSQYLGRYAMEIVPGLGWPTDAVLEVFEHDDRLRARLPFPIHPGDALEFDLVPAGVDRFNGGHYQRGRLFNIEMGVTWEFDLVDERAMEVRLRGVEGTVFARGARADQASRSGGDR